VVTGFYAEIGNCSFAVCNISRVCVDSGDGVNMA
jgi:hypothetical protein